MVSNVPGYEENKVIDSYKEQDGKLIVRYLNSDTKVFEKSKKLELDKEMTLQAQKYMKKPSLLIQAIHFISYFTIFFLGIKCGVNLLNSIITFKMTGILPIINYTFLITSSAFICNKIKKKINKSTFDVKNKRKFQEYFAIRKISDNQTNNGLSLKLEINKVQDYSVDELINMRENIEKNNAIKERAKVLVKK